MVCSCQLNSIYTLSIIWYLQNENKILPLKAKVNAAKDYLNYERMLFLTRNIIRITYLTIGGSFDH